MVFFFIPSHHQDWTADFSTLHGPAFSHVSPSSAGPGLSSCSQYPSILYGPGPASCFRALLHNFRVRYYYTSSYFRVKDSLHPDLSSHNNHISGFFSTQIITFLEFLPGKTTISAFIQQERSPKPAENSIFHICQKITCFDIFHLFCHFLRSAKITHFHKNTKNTYFHYFPLRWRFCDFPHFHQIPKNAKNEDFQ